MLTKLYSRDNEHLMDLLNSKIQEIPGVTATETWISLEPVSYTHLDVYKRQVLSCCAYATDRGKKANIMDN